MEKKKPTYYSLDILKFICAIIIACIYHYYNDFGYVLPFSHFPGLHFLTDFGFLFVELFFIVSGFLFYLNYFPKIKKKMKFSDFFIKRYSRLIPVVIITSIIMFFLQQSYNLIFKEFWIWDNNDFSNLLLQITGMRYWLIPTTSLNNAVWYISVLLFCYIIYYFITQFVIKKKNKWIFFLPLLFILFIKYSKIPVSFLNSFMIRGILSFSVGVIFGCFFVRIKNFTKPLLISFMSIIFFLMLYGVFHAQVLGEMYIYTNFFLFPSILLFFLSLESKMKWQPNEKMTRMIKYFGSLSFGIFVWNLPIQCGAALIDRVFDLNLNYGSWEIFLLQFLIHIIFAVMNYHVIEKQVNPFFERKVSTIFFKCNKIMNNNRM